VSETGLDWETRNIKETEIFDMSVASISKTVTPSSVAAPDLEAVKRRQQATWASGDFSVVAARIVFAAELLCETVDLQAGWRVLDVATGSGNAAIAAARRNCEAVGVDYVPALLERGRVRAAAEQLDVQFIEGDAEKLPLPTASFDAVLSVYGVMFAPNHCKAAAELARVCKPGGKIALASWTPDGYVGRMLGVIGKYVPAIAGLMPPIRWGDERYLRLTFGGSIRSIQSTVRPAIFRFASGEDHVEFFRKYYGPTLKAFEAVAPGDRAALAKDMAELARGFDRNQSAGAGPIAISADYLETVIVRK
jgi:ubiquinone/menaquinone biosynthesis C-methylase UbiE